MKKQITKLSPHQNAKVASLCVGILMLPFMIVMIFMMIFVTPSHNSEGEPINFPYFMFLLMPVVYMIMFYIFGLLGCKAYNFIQKYVGGFEFETIEKNDV